MGNLRKLANPASSSGGRKAGKHALGHARTHSSKRLRQGEDMIPVTDYYRNPPTPPWAASIKDKVWFVTKHWRHLPNVPTSRTWAQREKARERARARRRAHR